MPCPLPQRTRPHVRAALDAVVPFIRDYTARCGRAPTLREIAVTCRVPSGSVPYYLDILEAQGRLTRERGRPRSVRLA